MNLGSSEGRQLPRAPQGVVLDEEHEFERRIVRIAGEINKESASRAVMQLLYLNHLSPVEPATLIVDSQAGVVDDGLAIYDIIQYIKMPVRTHSAAGAMGMASLLVASGAAGSRTANPTAAFGLGHLSALQEPTAEIERTRGMLSRLYRQWTKMTAEQIREAWEDDSQFSAAAAVELGFIDRVVDEIEGR